MNLFSIHKYTSGKEKCIESWFLEFYKMSYTVHIQVYTDGDFWQYPKMWQYWFPRCS